MLLALAFGVAALALPGAANATVSSSFAGGTLSVSSNADDPITVACSGGSVTVNSGDVTGGPVACSAVTLITVTGGPMDNNPIDLNGVVPGTFTSISTSGTPVTINAGDGNDQVVGSAFGDQVNSGSGTNSVGSGDGNDHFTKAQDGSIDTMNGGSGNDTITFSGTSNGIVTATPTSINNLDGSNPVAEIEGAVFNAPFQENTFDLTDAPFPSTVNGHNSNDVFYSSAFNDTFNGGGQGVFDLVGAKTDSASIVLANTSMSGAGIGTDTITGAERAQILSPSVLGTSMAVVNSTWDASAFTGPVDLEGGTGDDTLIGGSANDTLGAPVTNPTGSLEEGDDTLIGNGSGDTLRGGPGTDTARATGVTSGVVNASNMNANGIDSFNSIEVASLTGTAGADTMNGSAFGGRVIFDGAAGNDMLTGSGQNDEITGGPDDDTMNAGGGLDRLIETAAAATSATLTDTALSGFGGAPNESISGFELVTLNGSAGADTFDASGFTGAATLVGGDGGDTLTGGSGADSFSGGAGDDTLNALDGSADASIDCGDENDSAQTDPVDPTPLGCETVNGQPTGGGPGRGPGTGPGTGPGSGPGGGGTLDTTAPVIGISAGRVNRRGRLPLRFTCPATEQSCSGTFVLTLAGKRTRLGSGRFTVRGGEVVLVKMKLTRRGRALLRKRGRLRATLRLTATDAAGNAATSRKSLRLRPAARR